MKEYITRKLKIAILPKGDPIFSEQATIIEIEGEAAGEYLAISQEPANVKHQKQILVETCDWSQIRDGIEMMIEEIKKHETP